KQDSLDVAPVDGPAYELPPASTREEVLALFDKAVVEGREAIAGASDQDLMQLWELLSGGNSIFKLPKAAVLRSFVFSHLIHHRAQLGVYLRLNDILVPAIYGPSADESGM